MRNGLFHATKGLNVVTDNPDVTGDELIQLLANQSTAAEWILIH
jgi:hypothetical protein